MGLFSQEELVLTDSSTIAVEGTSTLHDWVVTSHGNSGFLTLQNEKTDDVQNEVGQISALQLLIAVNALKGEKGETMNRKMWKALKSEDFPKIKYSLIEPIPKEAIGHENKIVETVGMLRIAGIEKEIRCPLELRFKDGCFYLKGKIPLQMSDYGIEPPTAMFGQIETGDKVVVNIDLKFTR